MKTILRSLAFLALAGCGWSVGSSSDERVQRPTLGQQLIDLKKARDAKAITDADYSTKRQELIDAALATK
ncbi:MAG TPA: hypothetical protein VJB14_08385 [Planctomycetota bacterium]|nr:hypothetical protein [Planctomycetota bacterium]